MSSKHDGTLKGHDLKDLRKLVEQKGKHGALQDPGARAVLTAAEKLDMQRKGFLKAMADLCAAADRMGIPKQTIIECLKGAVEGMERV